MYPDNDHLYKDCPHKEVRAIQEQFQVKLNEFLARHKNQTRFNPSHYKRDGFLTKMVVTMFNDICNGELDGQTWQALISSFVGEWQSGEQSSGHAGTVPVAANTRRRSARHHGNQDHDNVLSLPFWRIDDDEGVNATTNGATFQFAPQGWSFPIRYPITAELPHFHLPVVQTPHSKECVLT